MASLVMVAVLVHIGMAMVDVPTLWRQDQRRELWTVAILLLIGLFLASALLLGYRPVSVFRLIEAIFKPVGTLLFKAKGG